MVAATTGSVRWAIVGTGRMASQLAADLVLQPGSELVAVRSRSRESVDAFADRFGVNRRHLSLDDVLADESVDAVYVALPHPEHFPVARAALRAGKAVLCEKPFTVTAAEADELVEAAYESGAFLMEAMWTRFLPSMTILREVIASGVLGQIRAVTAGLCVRMPADPEGRLFSPKLAGGALLDLGVYPVSLASMVLGAPERIQATASFTDTGVDARTSMLFTYRDGAQAILTCSLDTDGPHGASIVGTSGRVDLTGPVYDPTSLTVRLEDDPKASVYDSERSVEQGRGWHLQVHEVERCLASGLTESPVMPWAESVAVMRTLDEVRDSIGLRFPFERRA